MSPAALVLHTAGAAETRALGRRLGRLLAAGDVLLLAGPLGAGKTTLAQGIGEALTVPGHVTSPTFVLLQQHDGRLPLYHADLYRLGDADEVAELALDEQAAAGVLLVEWPERGLDALPADHLWVELALDPPDHAESAEPAEPAEPADADRRRVTLRAAGERAAAILAALAAAPAPAPAPDARTGGGDAP